MDSQYELLSYQFFGNFKRETETGEEEAAEDDKKKWKSGLKDALENGRHHDCDGGFRRRWPYVDLSKKDGLISASHILKRNRRRKIRLEECSIRNSEDERRKIEMAPGRNPRAFVRCLICYSKLSGLDEVCTTTDDSRKHDGKEGVENMFPKFVSLLLTTTSKKMTERDTTMNQNGDDRLQKETMKLALKNPGVFLCNICSVATQRFVQACQALKELEELVFQMRTKFISAVKLSTEMASSQQDEMEMDESSSSRKMKTVVEAVSFLRMCFMHGGCPPEQEDHIMTSDLIFPELDLFADDEEDNLDDSQNSPFSRAADDDDRIPDHNQIHLISQMTLTNDNSSQLSLEEEAYSKPPTVKLAQTQTQFGKRRNPFKAKSTGSRSTMKKLSSRKSADRWRILKSKYPTIQEKYEALRQKKIALLQKCPNHEPPEGATTARQSWLKVPVEQAVGEDGEERLLFKNVEIKKLADGLFSCGICGESRKYKALSFAKTHINLNHIDLSNGFECEYCGKKFYYRKMLLNHLETSHHVGGATFQCEICGLTFASQPSRFYHKRVVHDGIKPHTCEYCGKAFGRRKDLTLHVRRHTGEKPFVCHVCADAFFDKQTMKGHIMRSHPEAAKDLPPPLQNYKVRRKHLDSEGKIGETDESLPDRISHISFS